VVSKTASHRFARLSSSRIESFTSILSKTASHRFARLSSSRIELTQTHRNNLRSLQGLFMLICFNKLAFSASSQK
jgi:hypothetical protein